MEQVFGMVNQLLMKNSETRKRKLKMRTYKVRVWRSGSEIHEWKKLAWHVIVLFIHNAKIDRLLHYVLEATEGFFSIQITVSLTEILH